VTVRRSGDIAEGAGIKQLSATQTGALMKKERLVSVESGKDDARQRVLQLTPQGRGLLPELATCWAATMAAADSLDAELRFPLSQCLADAIHALEAKSFGERIRQARAGTRAPARPASRRRVSRGRSRNRTKTQS
jgi:DNA-binding MarR family transcriptional regulator